MYASGIGIRRICATFEEERILAPGVYLFRKTGTKAFHPNLANPYRWTLTTVRRMLSNQFYCGDTVNFKTYSKSNKLKKRLKNDSSKVLIFKDTHEPIVDRALFETVQKHFAGRKRPDKMGEMDKFAGYLYCGDCGRRMYLHRGKSISPEKNMFQCGRYQQGKHNCTVHNIRESVIDAIVLENLKKVTSFARSEPEKFHELTTKRGKAEALKIEKKAEKEKATAEARIQKQAIKDFIEKAKEYVEMPKLTAELLHTFIQRVNVYEKPTKYSRTEGNPVMIYYKYQMTTSEQWQILTSEGFSEADDAKAEIDTNTPISA